MDAEVNKVFKLSEWEAFFKKPCFKTSIAYGAGIFPSYSLVYLIISFSLLLLLLIYQLLIVCGCFMAGHKLFLYRQVNNKVANAFILTSLLTSSISFMICSNELNTKYSMIKKAFQRTNIKEDKK